ncbi:MAG: NADH-quinone oxidoreductase subunit N [Verrucomicrobiota bacterium]|nr:NADH-quinone oxidoreductase subunit N [Verrucomicrobiota bacterium]
MIFLPAYSIEIGLILWGVVILMWDAFNPKADRGIVTGLSVLVLLWLTGLSFFGDFEIPSAFFNELYIHDGFSAITKPLILISSLFTVVLIYEYRSQIPLGFAELIFLVMMATTGMMILCSVNEFMTLFVSLELVTISFYVMVSFLRKSPRSLEAGIKFLVISALTSAFLLMGIAYYFGILGTTSLINALPAEGFAIMALVFIITGLGFKVALVPFHIWVPDTYQGAPTPITAFLATASKVVGYVALMRVLFLAFATPSMVGLWSTVLAAVAGVTMLFGNLAALPQTNIKRILAYSSIGHTGFVLLGLSTVNGFGLTAVVYYLFAYVIATILCFLVLIIVSNTSHSENIIEFSGLAKRSPGLAFAMTIGLVSLAGIPPLAGFFGKFLVFSAAIYNAPAYPGFWILVAVGIISTLIGLYYYLGIVKMMYFGKVEDDRALHYSTLAKFTMIVLIVAVFALGICQNTLTTWITNSLGNFGSGY